LNTEYVAHQLQTAFGMIGLARELDPATRIIGLVVVCCSDGAAKMYDVEPRFVSRTHFKPVVAAAPTRSPATASFLKLPESPEVQAQVLTRLKSLGYHAIDKRGTGKYGSFVVRSRPPGGFAVVALVYAPNTDHVLSTGKQNRLVSDAKALWTAKKKKNAVRALVCYYSENSPDFIHRTEFIGIAHKAVAPRPVAKKKAPAGKKAAKARMR
jgi:hypothetical protein